MNRFFKFQISHFMKNEPSQNFSDLEEITIIDDESSQSDDLIYNQPLNSFNDIFFDISDFWILLIILFLGFESRIWAVYSPDQSTAVDQYYGSMLNSIIQKKFVVDREPLLSLFIIGYYMKMLGYSGSNEFKAFESFSEPTYTSIRWANACFSGFSPGLLYISLRNLKMSKIISFTGSLMLISEFSLITQARLISLDGPFHFFVFLTILSSTFINKVSMKSFTFNFSTIFTGISMGLAFSTKFQSFYLIFYIMSFGFFIKNDNQFNQNKFSSQFKNYVQQSSFIFIPIIFVALITFFLFLSLQILLLPKPNLDYSIMFQEIHGGNSTFNFLSPFKLLKIMKKSSPAFQKESKFFSSLMLYPFGLSKIYIYWDKKTLESQHDYQDEKILAIFLNYFNTILGTLSISFSLFVLLFAHKSKNGYLHKETKFEHFLKQIFGININPKTNFLFSNQIYNQVLLILPFILTYLLSILFIGKLKITPDEFIIPQIFGIFSFIGFLNYLSPFWQGFFCIITQFLSVFSFVLWSPWCYSLPGGKMLSRLWFNSWFPNYTYFYNNKSPL